MSINLTATEAFFVGGVQQFSNASAEISNYSVDLIAGILHFNIVTGNLANGSFTQGQFGSKATIDLNLSTGAWTNSQNGNTGTLSPQALAGVVTSVNTDRNGLETIAVNQGIILGTQVPNVGVVGKSS